MEWDDFRIHRQLAQTTGNQLGVLRSEVEDEDGLMCHDQQGRGPTAEDSGSGRAVRTRYYTVVFTLRATICSVLALLVTPSVGSGQQPNRTESSPIPLFPAEQAWIVTLPSPTSAGGAMDDERIYVPLQSEELTALDRETGEVVWVRAIESAWPPVVHGGVVYLAASDELHALAAATGDTLWRAPLEPLAAPLVYDTGWLLAVVEPGDVVAMRAADGRQLWRLAGAAPRSHAVAATTTRLLHAGRRSRRIAEPEGRIETVGAATAEDAERAGRRPDRWFIGRRTILLCPRR